MKRQLRGELTIHGRCPQALKPHTVTVHVSVTIPACRNGTHINQQLFGLPVLLDSPDRPEAAKPLGKIRIPSRSRRVETWRVWLGFVNFEKRTAQTCLSACAFGWGRALAAMVCLLECSIITCK